MVDTLVLGTSAFGCEGSSPSRGTIITLLCYATDWQASNPPSLQRRARRYATDGQANNKLTINFLLMDNLEEKIFAARIDEYIYSIDLHESGSVSAALEQLESELFFCFCEKKLYCRVVHGIGKGVLAKAVHSALENNPMVVEWECEGGSCILLF